MSRDREGATEPPKGLNACTRTREIEYWRLVFSRERSIVTSGPSLPDGRGSLTPRIEDGHWFALLFDYVADSSSQVLIPLDTKPKRTSVPRPAFAFRIIETRLIQGAASVGFQVVHHTLRPNVRLHHDMEVSAANMGRDQVPGTVLANGSQCLQDDCPPGMIHP